MMKILKSPIVIGIIGFVAGVFMADTVKPMLSKIPVIGSFFGGSEE